MSHLKHAVELALIVLAISPVVLAQSVSDGNQTGLPPFGTFHGSNFDLVSLQNGNLHMEIPIVNVPQRGGRNLSLRYIYDTPTWEMNRNYVDVSSPPLWIVATPPSEVAKWRLVSQYGWSVDYTINEAQCTWTDSVTGQQQTVYYWERMNWVLTESDGTKHPFALWHEANTQHRCSKGLQLNGSALDGSGVFMDISTSFDLPLVIFKDGFRSDVGDPNGNRLEPIDTLGRQIVTFTRGPNFEIWTIKDSNGNPQQYRVDYTNVAIQTNLCGLLPANPAHDCVEYSETWSMPATLTLPNGKAYQFTWQQNGHGELLRVDLPTGGSISYAYTSRAYGVHVPLDRNGGYGKYNARREVTTRAVNDGQATRTWAYSEGATTSERVVQDPLGNEELHIYSYVTVGSYRSNGKYETEARFYQGSRISGTLLRTIKKDYTGEVGPTLFDDPTLSVLNVRLIRETTILEDNKQSKVETDYETFQQPYLGVNFTATRFNVSEKREHAYGAGAPGSLVRRTTYSYLHTNNQPYISRNVVDRVTTTSVYDGGGALQSQSVNEYDVYTEPIQATGAVQHDNINYGPWFLTRGNVTASRHWRNTDGAWLETRHQYDDAGNIVKTTDPQGHVTTFDYSDAWANAACAPAGPGRAYLQSVTNPLGHVTRHTYNSCTGSMASTTDPNNQTTTFSYDFMDRPDITNLPGGGQVDRDYDDYGLWVRTKTLRAPGAYVVSYSRYDGLGRVIREELCEDGTDACTSSIKTDTSYDAVGRKGSVTNPYRTTGDPTYGVTRFEYDALSRTQKVVPPDSNGLSNFVLTEYLGNTVTVTDQAGKQRRSFTDALGRLIEVHEPAGGTSPAPGTGSSTIAGTLQTVGGSSPAPGTGSANVSGSLQSAGGTPGTPGTGSVTVSGSEQVRGATQATGTVSITGSEQAEWREVLVWGCVLYDESGGCMEEGWISEWQWVYDSGSVYVAVNGQYKSAWYGQGSTGDSIAQDLANAINADGSYPVTASAGGTVLYLTSKTYGAGANYSLAAGSGSYENFDPPSFVPAPSGSNLTGGADTVYDAGTVSITVNGSTKSAGYGQGSTSNSIASALGNAINADGAYPVTA